MSILTEQKDLIDRIDFHLSMSDISNCHPEHFNGIMDMSNMLRGYCKFVQDELEDLKDDELTLEEWNLILKVGGISMLKYLVGDRIVEKINKMVREAYWEERRELRNKIKENREAEEDGSGSL